MSTTRTPSVTLAATCVSLLVANHVVARACRDALFLSHFPATELPKVMLAAAVVGLLAVLGSARLMTRLGPGRLIPVLLLASGALHAVEWLLLGAQPKVAVVTLYLHASIIGGIAVSGFWSTVTERYDPHSVRRVAGYLAAGAATGGLLGGLFARFFGVAEGPAALLPVLAASTVPAAVMVLFVSGHSQLFEPAPGTSRTTSSETTSSYLKALAVLVTLTALSGALVDFAFKVAVADRIESGESLVAFFALFYTATSVGSVLLQLSVSRWALSSLGIGTTLATLPLAIVGIGLFGVFLPSMWPLVVLRGAGATLERSLFRSAYEPLYAPLPTDKKRSAKTLIDVACDRIGDVLGSGLVLGVGAVLPAFAPRAALVTAVAAAAVCVWLSIRLERGYVAELAESLRSGKFRLEDQDVEDATTRLTLSQTQLEIHRDTLLKQIEALRRNPPAPDAPEAPEPELAAGNRAAVDARLSALRSDNPARVRAALGGVPLEPELVSFVVSLLADDATAGAATRALRRVAVQNAGQLTDALLDPSRPLALRLRIPRVLRDCAHPRVVRGLAEALSDAEFDLRLRAGLALRDLVHKDPALKPPSNLVLAAARHEVDEHQSLWAEGDASNNAGASPSADSELAALGKRALDHVFTLLGLAFDAEAVELARRALSTDDAKLRGTALEYLEHVVPEAIRVAIWPQLQAGLGTGHARGRSATEIVDELKRSLG